MFDKTKLYQEVTLQQLAPGDICYTLKKHYELKVMAQMEDSTTLKYMGKLKEGASGVRTRSNTEVVLFEVEK